MAKRAAKVDWAAVIGRCLAVLAMEEAELLGAPPEEKRRFLAAMGLPEGDAGALLEATGGENPAAPAPKAAARVRRPTTAGRKTTKRAGKKSTRRRR